MDISKLQEGQTAEVDLHGMTVFDAEISLHLFLDELPKGVRAVKVTHGYSRGTALKRMVKNEFHHWRVASKRVDLNPGITYLILK